MGGDHAPRAPIAGALLALAELDPAHSIQLVGPTAAITAELDQLLGGEHAGVAAQRNRLEIIEAPDIISMTDKPSAVLRGRQRSSMVVGIKLQSDHRSDAFVSAGNTGAQMAASKELLGLHEGLRRPAIATVFPTARQPVVVIDSGANMDSSPEELVQFGRLGAVYAEDLLGRKDPAVGLLSVGEEPEKGNKAVKEAHQLLMHAQLRFVGNVEGRDILAGATERGPIDVVVCDGFVGNVLLKFYEGVPTMLVGLLRKSSLDRGALESVLATLDYSERGGAPLLGVRGVSIICHGKSDARAIKNGIKVGLRAVQAGLSDHIGRRLAASGGGNPGGSAGGSQTAVDGAGTGSSATGGRAAGAPASPSRRSSAGS